MTANGPLAIVMERDMFVPLLCDTPDVIFADSPHWLNAGFFLNIFSSLFAVLHNFS